MLHRRCTLDNFTETHMKRLETIVDAFATAAGYSELQTEEIKLFARLHDIGKLRIARDILLKPGALSQPERDEIQRHSAIGREIIEKVAAWIERHHEHWDGNGYPGNLAATQIPTECRILAIADAYDAMTNDRPYRKALTHAQAVQEIQACAGTQFDPELVMQLLPVLDRLYQEQSTAKERVEL